MPSQGNLFSAHGLGWQQPGPRGSSHKGLTNTETPTPRNGTPTGLVCGGRETVTASRNRLHTWAETQVPSWAEHPCHQFTTKGLGSKRMLGRAAPHLSPRVHPLKSGTGKAVGAHQVVEAATELGTQGSLAWGQDSWILRTLMSSSEHCSESDVSVNCEVCVSMLIPFWLTNPSDEVELLEGNARVVGAVTAVPLHRSAGSKTRLPCLLSGFHPLPHCLPHN